MKILQKIWELMGDEKFTLPIIALFVTFMTLINLAILIIPVELQAAMVALNVGLIIATLMWLLTDKEDK